jgi:hypothetical protein
MKDTYVSDCRPLLACVRTRVACLREPLDRTRSATRWSPTPLVRNQAWTLRLAWLSCAAYTARQYGELR